MTAPLSAANAATRVPFLDRWRTMLGKSGDFDHMPETLFTSPSTSGRARRSTSARTTPRSSCAVTSIYSMSNSPVATPLTSPARQYTFPAPAQPAPSRRSRQQPTLRPAASFDASSTRRARTRSIVATSPTRSEFTSKDPPLPRERASKPRPQMPDPFVTHAANIIRPTTDSAAVLPAPNHVIATKEPPTTPRSQLQRRQTISKSSSGRSSKRASVASKRARPALEPLVVNRTRSYTSTSSHSTGFLLPSSDVPECPSPPRSESSQQSEEDLLERWRDFVAISTPTRQRSQSSHTTSKNDSMSLPIPSQPSSPNRPVPLRRNPAFPNLSSHLRARSIARRGSDASIRPRSPITPPDHAATMIRLDSQVLLAQMALKRIDSAEFSGDVLNRLSRSASFRPAMSPAFAALAAEDELATEDEGVGRSWWDELCVTTLYDTPDEPVITPPLSAASELSSSTSWNWSIASRESMASSRTSMSLQTLEEAFASVMQSCEVAPRLSATSDDSYVCAWDILDEPETADSEAEGRPLPTSDSQSSSIASSTKRQSRIPRHYASSPALSLQRSSQASTVVPPLPPLPLSSLRRPQRAKVPPPIRIPSQRSSSLQRGSSRSGKRFSSNYIYAPSPFSATFAKRDSPQFSPGGSRIPILGSCQPREKRRMVHGIV